MTDQQQNDRGWGFPAGSRKAHYFDGTGTSLCGRWGFMSDSACTTEDAEEPSLDDCAACRRKYALIREETNG